MAIKGDLKDMGLPTLIQMICTEQRKAALVVRHQRIEDGVLYFADGEIVDARSGTLVGEEAVYKVLQWQEGAFHLNDQVRIPRRTINAPWRYLVLEGMKKMDEEGAGISAEAQQDLPLTSAQLAADELQETAVIHLLSKLEFEHAHLQQRKNHRHPAFILETLSKMVNETAVFAKSHFPSGTISLEAAKEIVQEEYPAVRLLQQEKNQLMPDVVANLYNNWSAGKSSRQKMFNEMAFGLVDIQRLFFLYIIASFNSKSIAEQWHEAYRVFLDDLIKNLERVKF